MASVHRNNPPGAIVLALILGACSPLRSEPPPIIQYNTGTSSEEASVARTPRDDAKETGLAYAPHDHPDLGEVGIASWYGRRYHGRKTASGERFDMNALTAAHPTLPFGTRVRVSNLENDRSVVVVINDRGPFVNGRIIDVSRHAAEHLGFKRQGTARVRVRAVESRRSDAVRTPVEISTRSAQIVVPPARLQCVTYARMVSKVSIRGDAWTWWQSAEGHYRKDTRPAVGSILVLKRTERLHLGHLSVVTRVVNAREILVDHANWLNRGQIHENVPVRDVSANNDWSAVRVWYTPGNTYGRRTYLAYGFIHPGQV